MELCMTFSMDHFFRTPRARQFENALHIGKASERKIVAPSAGGFILVYLDAESVAKKQSTNALRFVAKNPQPINRAFSITVGSYLRKGNTSMGL
jgi:hypothetical protein